MRSLQQSLENYLAIRRALGFKLERAGLWLPGFVRFLGEHGSSFITTELALRWAMGPKNPPPRSWPNRLSMVRKFAQYLHARDPRNEIPSFDHIPPSRSQRMKPYVYTQTDVHVLMAATSKACRNELKTETYSALIGLLACTGMRVGEAIALDRSDFDAKQGSILIRQGKFGKSRQLPLHPSALRALHRYELKRDRLLPHPSSPAFFLSSAGTRLHYKNVHHCFLHLVRISGLDKRPPHRPRIHDLRHTFAIQTLIGWYRSGWDTEPRIPILSTYLGHVAPSCTYWYLSATPELLEQASRRLEKALGGRP